MKDGDDEADDAVDADVADRTRHLRNLSASCIVT